MACGFTSTSTKVSTIVRLVLHSLDRAVQPTSLTIIDTSLTIVDTSLTIVNTSLTIVDCPATQPYYRRYLC